MSKTEEMSGLRKAAVLLVQLGKDEAGKLLAQLPEAEVEELSTEIARLGRVDPESAGEVLTEFHTMAKHRPPARQSGPDQPPPVRCSLAARRAGSVGYSRWSRSSSGPSGVPSG